MVTLGLFGLLLAVCYIVLLLLHGGLALKDWWESIVGPSKKALHPDKGKRYF